MAEYSALGRKPIFCPSVGSFEQGMVVSVPIHYDQLHETGRSGEAIQLASNEGPNVHTTGLMPSVSSSLFCAVACIVATSPE